MEDKNHSQLRVVLQLLDEILELFKKDRLVRLRYPLEDYYKPLLPQIRVLNDLVLLRFQGGEAEYADKTFEDVLNRASFS